MDVKQQNIHPWTLFVLFGDYCITTLPHWRLTHSLTNVSQRTPEHLLTLFLLANSSQLVTSIEDLASLASDFQNDQAFSNKISQIAKTYTKIRLVHLNWYLHWGLACEVGFNYVRHSQFTNRSVWLKADVSSIRRILLALYRLFIIF